MPKRRYEIPYKLVHFCTMQGVSLFIIYYLQEHELRLINGTFTLGLQYFKGKKVHDKGILRQLIKLIQVLHEMPHYTEPCCITVLAESQNSAVLNFGSDSHAVAVVSRYKKSY